MKILLDTQLLIFAAEGNVPPKAIHYIENKANTLLFSSASIWEITIKTGLNRADFSIDPTALYNGLLGAGYEELPIISRHSLTVRSLPTVHKDPFDRILLAQAISEGVTFITTDEILKKYPGSVIFVG
jgi:PIN domain nuclease of toxin-antitoxin system